MNHCMIEIRIGDPVHVLSVIAVKSMVGSEKQREPETVGVAQESRQCNSTVGDGYDLSCPQFLPDVSGRVAIAAIEHALGSRAEAAAIPCGNDLQQFVAPHPIVWRTYESPNNPVQNASVAAFSYLHNTCGAPLSVHLFDVHRIVILASDHIKPTSVPCLVQILEPTPIVAVIDPRDLRRLQLRCDEAKRSSSQQGGDPQPGKIGCQIEVSF